MIGYDSGMNDGDALLAAIIANPDDDTPRLVYADWLDENGQPERAEFIRIQCAPGKAETGWSRSRELEASSRARWLAGLPKFPNQWEVGRRDWEFRRGFPEYLTAPISDFLERWEEAECVPWLRALSLRHIDSERLQEFANRRWHPRWVELVIEGPWSIRGVPPDYTTWLRVLTSCSQAAQLNLLWFSGLFDFTEEGIDLLIASPHLANLRQLHLYGEDEDSRFTPLRERFGDRLVIDGDYPAFPRM